MITILSQHGDRLTTPQILELASNYPELCKGCSSGTEVISAGLKLVELGLIKREIAKGGFVWSLTTSQE